MTNMTTRRTAIAMMGSALAAPRAFGASPKKPHWPPYRNAMAIDGAAGLALRYLDPDDPAQADAIARELQTARASGLAAVITTMAPQGQYWLDDAAAARARDELVKWNAIIARYPGDLAPIRSAGDLRRAHEARKLGIVYAFQGTEPIGENLARLDDYHALGLRVVQLTHNRRNLVGDGSVETGNAGLSNFGREVVARLNEMNIIVDLAHGAPRTISEGIAASAAPPLISHSGCRALADHPRNVDDATLGALADKGGVMGVIFWPYLREDTQPMAIDVIRHIEHAINIAGEDHVGIGTDGFVAPIERTKDYEEENREWVREAVADGVFQAGRPADLYTFIPDLNHADRFERLAFMLAQRGHKDARIEKVLGGNFARVMTAVWGE